MSSIIARIFPCILFSVLTLLLPIGSFAEDQAISVRGDVKRSLKITLDDLKKMDEFHVDRVVLVKPKKKSSDPEQFTSMSNIKGVLLRDILEKAGMKYVRKWEPGVYVRVKGANGGEVVFSFGEIFYSSIGRSILLAYEEDGEKVPSSEGIGELITTTDVRSGRQISGVKEILVGRVDVEMKVYEEREKNIVRPPTSELLLSDKKTGKTMQIKLDDLKKLDPVFIENAVMAGDCEGFHGIYSFRGASLPSLLEKFGVDEYGNNYDRYALICSENGFCAVFSFGELFNSRLSKNIIIAYERDGKLLDETDGFARSVVREDALGGRSVRRISRIELY